MVDKSLRRSFTSAMLAATALTACVSHQYYPVESRLIRVSQKPVLDMFEYRSSLRTVSLAQPTGLVHGYLAYPFAMQASFDNGQPGDLITGTYYQSGLTGKKPLVIVLPVWGVSEYPSEIMSRAILKRSHGEMNVLRVDGEHRLMAWEEIEHSTDLDTFVAGVSDSAARLKHAVVDVRRLIDWGQTRDEINRQRVGLVGFSVSAVVGTLVVQSDDRVKSSALIMGGAKIGKIMTECPGNEQSTRDGVIRNLGLDVGEYEKIVTALLRGLDPTDYPDRVNPQSILIADAAKDDCIPKAARDAWWEALGRPERFSFNYNHRKSFLAMTPLGFNFLRRKIYQHLEKTL